MTKYLVFTEEQFEAGIAELATLSFHGGFLARREIGDPVAVLDALPAAPSPDVERAERADTVADALRALYARWPSGMTAEVDGMFRSLFKSLSPAAPASPVPEVQPDPGAWSDELKMAQVATRYWQDVINGKRDADPTADDQRKLHLARLGEAVLLATEAMDR